MIFFEAARGYHFNKPVGYICALERTSARRTD